jgi:hypothetical protein
MYPHGLDLLTQSRDPDRGFKREIMVIIPFPKTPFQELAIVLVAKAIDFNRCVHE